MRIAVLSDIHSNIEALQAVVGHAGVHLVDRYVCLGDVVGYGANPNECISLVSSLGSCLAVLGNHDAAALGTPVHMDRDAQKAIAWTRSVLTKSSKWFLHEMKDVIHLGDIVFCHSNPYRPKNWYYVTEKTYISSSFARTKAKVIFVGHTHVPVAITRKNFFCIYIRSPQHSMVVPVAELNRQIFNAGSVGQPRDGDPRAAYLIYDTRKSVIEFYRVGYDVNRASRKIAALGLPEKFADRLVKGV
ncbi:metallophosphoesterase family protein [Desulforhopalus singaporensis]|uniref:Predicted phosphodiesterase n=1 Tax=Desulforhopalus singaporensis TaxID=91360 RepID=A0A1H0RK08_9BACT|nr:metallophosphoesterase family protein [Desulforhopalus singaporensis]SDP29781.1 Predicted phosphodiesterase [Desulforhopalus singaporensis]